MTVDIEPAEIDQAAPLPLIAADIRRLQKIVVGIRAALLRTSMDLGDRLSWARARVSVRGWKAWREQHCPGIGRRSDEVYRQLAAHRDRIEQELVTNPDLSIRQALGTIRPVAVKPKRKPKPPTLEAWCTIDLEAKRAGLEHDGLDRFLEYMPPEWRNELADRVSRIGTKHKTAKDRVFSSRLREEIEKNPEGPLAKYVHDQAIDPKRLVVHVAAIDAPSKRRPALVDSHAPAPSTAVH